MPDARTDEWRRARADRARSRPGILQADRAQHRRPRATRPYPRPGLPRTGRPFTQTLRGRDLGRPAGRGAPRGHARRDGGSLCPRRRTLPGARRARRTARARCRQCDPEAMSQLDGTTLSDSGLRALVQVVIVGAGVYVILLRVARPRAFQILT